MGDGGLLVTDDDDVAARCRRLRDHGRLNKDVHVEVGFNLRFNDIQAAVGRVLLRRLDAMNDHRRALAARYQAGLAGLPLVLPGGDAGRAPRLSPLRRAHARGGTSSRDSSRSAASPRASTTRCRATGSPPSSTSSRALPETERIVKEILTLPISAGHTDAEIDEVVAAVRDFFAK